MKTLRIFLPILSVLIILAITACNDNTTTSPCDGKGQVCITNKMDTTVVVNIIQSNLQFSIHSDEMKCIPLDGGIPYTINFTMNTTYWDTTILVSNCDYKNLILE